MLVCTYLQIIELKALFTCVCSFHVNITLYIPFLSFFHSVSSREFPILIRRDLPPSFRNHYEV